MKAMDSSNPSSATAITQRSVRIMIGARPRWGLPLVHGARARHAGAVMGCASGAQYSRAPSAWVARKRSGHPPSDMLA
jgi:hypothetical protein